MCQEHIKERSEQRQWMRKRNSMGSYYSVINNLRLTENKILEITYEWIHYHMCRFKIKIMCFHLFYTEQVGTVYQKVLYNSCLSCCTNEASLCFTQKNNFCIMNKIKVVRFIIHKLFFLSKNVIFLYISKIFFPTLHLKIFSEYWIILYIFKILLCVASP